MPPVLVRHDPGCHYARIEDAGGHTDDAKRLFDGFNLHRLASHVLVGMHRGVVAVALVDGTVGDDIYDSRAHAVGHLFPNEARYFYLRLGAPSVMTVCEAASVLRWQRVMASMHPADRDQPRGGRVAIPRMTIEDREHQIQAVRSGRGMLALGYERD